MTVFLKGCPLRCQWCHNPETISSAPQLMRSPAGDRMIGRRYSSAELAAIVLAEADVLRANQGGVTFSGGEPLLQSPFLAEVIDQIRPLHVVLDTSGYAPPEVFRQIAPLADVVYFDLKLINPDVHRHYTSTGNGLILENFRWLTGSGIPCVVRVPLVPGVTDTPENLERIAHTVCGCPSLQRVDFMPYNGAAGGKYAGLGMQFHPDYDEKRPLNMDFRALTAAGVQFRIVGAADARAAATR